ncbi:MAG: pentapeptide repeat-containing protein [Planctomycetota bacterium]
MRRDLGEKAGSVSEGKIAKGPSRRKEPFGPRLAGRDLGGRSLVGANLEGADLRACNLSGADLRGARLYGAWFDGANLTQTRFDMTRIVEIALPESMPADIVNQVRAFDFQQVMTRYVGPNRESESLVCPYRDSRVEPLLYRWGSDTWNAGCDWAPPSEMWTLEEIIASVLDELGCRHGLRRPLR